MAVMTRRGALALGTAALAAGCATRGTSETAAAPVRAQPVMGEFGLELEARNLSVAAGDDFYRHAAGTWLDATQIPSDRTRWGSFDILADKA